MKKIYRFYYLAGTVLFFAGSLLCRYGWTRMIGYIRAAVESSELTGGQLGRGLVVPHMMVLFGGGGAVFGLIMIVRAVMLRKRISGRE